jgi:hypothetical protein
MALPHKRGNPFIPKPQPKEEPVHEELVHPPALKAVHADRPLMYKQDIPLLVPKYNRLYDTFRTEQGWRYAADAYANGTVTTIAGNAVLVDVDLTLPANTQSPNWRLEQWPGGTQLFLVIRFFSMGPQTASFATQGEIDVVFQDDYGNNAPMGVVPNNAFYSNNNDTIMPTPITDSGTTAMGTLSFTLNSGATIGTYSWQMAFAAAYLMPAINGYKRERISDAEYSEHLHNRMHQHSEHDN